MWYSISAMRGTRLKHLVLVRSLYMAGSKKLIWTKKERKREIYCHTQRKIPAAVHTQLRFDLGAPVTLPDTSFLLSPPMTLALVFPYTDYPSVATNVDIRNCRLELYHLINSTQTKIKLLSYSGPRWLWVRGTYIHYWSKHVAKRTTGTDGSIFLLS